jgi:hypothetical protein
MIKKGCKRGKLKEMKKRVTVRRGEGRKEERNEREEKGVEADRAAAWEAISSRTVDDVREDR